MTDHFKPEPAKNLVETSVGRLAVWEYGRPDGRVAIFWPSLFSDRRLYEAVVDRLKDDWRVLVIDGPGFGASEAPKKGVQPDRYAAAVIEVMDKLSIGTCVFGGTSWGGQIGAHLAVLAPDRLDGLLVMNAPLNPSFGGHWFEVIMARLAVSSSLYANGVAKAMLSTASLARSPELLDRFTAPFKSFNARDAATTASTVLRSSPGLSDVLPRIRVPTTFLLGADDKLYPPDTLKPLAALTANATIEVLPGTGHLAPLEAPDAVARAVRAFSSPRIMAAAASS